MNYRPPSHESLRSSLRCFAMVVLNLLLAIGFAVLNSGYPVLHIALALAFALATEHHRRKHLEELEEEQRAARMASVEALLQKNEYSK